MLGPYASARFCLCGALVSLSLTPPLISADSSPAPVAARRQAPRPDPNIQRALAPEAIERVLFESINKERAVRGLAPLKLSSPLSDVARKHSEEMARLGRLAHESAAGGTVKERLDRALVANAFNAENVAHSSSFDPRFIHGALMDSAGHRENILLPDVDEVGIGVVRAAGGDYYVTQDFLRSVTWLDEADAAEAVIGVLDEVRRSRGLAPLAVLDDVSRQARALARLKANGRDLPSLPRGLGEVRTDFYAGVEIEAIAARIREQALERYGVAGVGVHVGPAPGYPAGAYQVCTLLLAADLVLLRDEPARVRTVLEAVNAARKERGLDRLEPDAALADRAAAAGARFGRGRSEFSVGSARPPLRLSGTRDTATTIIYETSDLGRLTPVIGGRVAGRSSRRIGISVKPAGPGLTVFFTVVLLIED